MSNFIVQASALHASLKGALVATSDAAPVFDGVLIETGTPTGLRVVATDRYRIAVGDVSVTELSGDPLTIHVSSDGVKLLIDGLKSIIKLNKAARIAVEISVDEIIIGHGDVYARAAATGLAFPKYESLIPTDFSGVPGDESIGFNPAFLSDIYKISGKIDKVSIQFNGATRPALATFNDNYGVAWRYLLMPVRL